MFQATNQTGVKLGVHKSLVEQGIITGEISWDICEWPNHSSEWGSILGLIRCLAIKKAGGAIAKCS